MRLEQLADLFERERQESVEFREEVRTHIQDIRQDAQSLREDILSQLADIHQWAAVREARDEEAIKHRALVVKTVSWIIGTIITVAGIILPLLLGNH
jgi:hypothetical protein